jgi:N-acetylneuraminic acid mutarotase
MRKSRTLLLVLVFLTASCTVISEPASSSIENTENSWTTKAPMPQGKSDLGLTVVDRKIYAIGGTIKNYVDSWTEGFSGTRKVVNTNYEYDPALDRWVTKPPMPTPRYNFATVVHEDSIYCLGGTYFVGNPPYHGTAVLTAAVEVFNLSTNKWEKKTPMPTRRGFFATILYADNIYCIGGGINEVYNIATDTWQTEAPMPFNGSVTTANVVNGKLYLTSDSLMYIYNPATNSWASKEAIQTETYGPVSAVIDNKIYFISANLTQIYDTETDTVSLGAPPLPNYFGVALAMTGDMAPKRIYICGETLQVYDPETDSWTIGAKMPTNRDSVSFAVVNEKIYAIGGNIGINSPGVFPNYPTISVTQYATNEEYTPIGYGTAPPKIYVISPENQNYNVSSVPLTFTVNRPVAWMGYSLDGEDNVTIDGNTTIAELSNGLHNITVYAKDSFENTGASEAISFSVDVPESFPTLVVTAVAVASLAVVGIGLLVYFKKRRVKSGG